ncbi:MAG: hypothetical protein WAV00_16785 [Nocardioides sp.]
MTSAIDRSARPYSRTIWVLVVVAVLWSIGLLVAAMTYPAYESKAVTDSTVVNGSGASHEVIKTSQSTATLVDVNGYHALGFIALPLLASLIVAFALLRRRRGRVASLIAWIVTGMLGLANLLAMLTVGPVMLPVTGCLVMACGFDLGRHLEQVSPVTAAG